MTIGKLSIVFGFSRSTLLYYDKIGLIRPSARSKSGYRLYNDKDVSRLEQIIVLRNAGVPLHQIGSLLTSEETEVFGKLLKRLGEMNSEIEQIKECQNYIISILSGTPTAAKIKDHTNSLIE